MKRCPAGTRRKDSKCVKKKSNWAKWNANQKAHKQAMLDAQEDPRYSNRGNW